MPKILANELDRLVQNALLFADAEAMRIQEVYFYFASDGLSIYACDDYVTISDNSYIETPDKEFSLSVSDTEKLGKWIKEDKKVVHKSEIDIRFKMTGVIFESEDSETKIFLPYINPSTLWGKVLILLNEDQKPMLILDFAIRPERLDRIHRLKAPREENKEAPIHIRGIDINTHLILQFKKGSSIVGAIQPVRIDLVKEEFLW